MAVLAKEHAIPFYVAAPVSTIDPEIPEGDAIPIEQRDPSEITVIDGRSVAPKSVNVQNPAFDVTPNHLVTAIITEEGIARAPYQESILQLLEKAGRSE